MTSRRMRRLLGPWLLAGLGAWFVLDNGPAVLEAWRIRSAGESSTATVLSVEGARPRRAARRLADDLIWGANRRVTYRFAARDRPYPEEAAFVSHHAADALSPGASVEVRYLAADPAVHRLEAEPGFVVMALRTVLGLSLGLLGLSTGLQKLRRTRDS